MGYFRHVLTWSWCFSLFKCLIHFCVFYGDGVVCYLRNLETHNAGVTLPERNRHSSFSGVGGASPESSSTVVRAAKMRFNGYDFFPCCCTRCIGVSFAWYSEKRHPVRTFGPLRKVWLRCYCNLWNAQRPSTGLTHKTYHQRFPEQ